MKFKCNVCHVFEYDDEEGLEEINPGTAPEDFPESWKCPICQSDKTHLEPLD
jgi:rubredoxin